MRKEQIEYTRLGISHLTEIVHAGHSADFLTYRDSFSSWEDEAKLFTGVSNVAIIFLVKLSIATGKSEKELLQELAIEFANK